MCTRPVPAATETDLENAALGAACARRVRRVLWAHLCARVSSRASVPGPRRPPGRSGSALRIICARRTPSCQAMDDACSAVVRTRSVYAHMRTQTGVLWGALGRCVFRIQPGCVCGGQAAGRESALWHAHLRTRCARAHMRSACYTSAPPHAQIRYRLQSAEPSLTGGKDHVRKTQKEMVPGVFYIMRTCGRGPRECSICAHAHALRRCADAQVHCARAHMRSAPAVRSYTRTYTTQSALLHSAEIYIYLSSIPQRQRQAYSRPACTSLYALRVKKYAMIQCAHDPCQQPQSRTRKRRAGCCVRSACAACALGTP